MKCLRISLAWLVAMCSCPPSITAFVPLSASRSALKSRCLEKDPLKLHPVKRINRPSTTTLNMFMGSDGGILGVGAPELFTVLLVGYFVLGPSDLYKVVKEIGKFVQNFRTLGADLSKTVESNFENQLQLEEIRKAQRELNDAFNFRRTINVDQESQAFSTKANSESKSSSSDAGSTTKKKKIRKRLKKRVVPQEEAEQQPVVEEPTTATAEPAPSGVVEDLDMTDAFTTDDEAARIREERMERLKQSGGGEEAADDQEDSWFNEPAGPDRNLEEQERFAAQMSENWNQQILRNEDKLSPLAQVMERLAILEEEKNVADARLEEEFRLRAELEEKYYKEKRTMLEEAAAQVQADAYVSMNKESNNDSTA